MSALLLLEGGGSPPSPSTSCLMNHQFIPDERWPRECAICGRRPEAHKEVA